MNFSGLTRPEDFAKLATPLPKEGFTNKSGLQGAHVVGRNEWNSSLLEILDQLKSDRVPNFGPDALFNGVLLPESQQGGTAVAAGNHNGMQLRVFDRLFFNDNKRLRRRVRLRRQ